MRLIGRLSLFYKIVFIEAAILFFIGAVFYSQLSNTKSDLIKQSVAASALIGEEASEFVVHTGTPTSSQFQSFLMNKHGRNGMFKSFEVTPSSFNVMFNEEAGWRGQVYLEKGYGITSKDGIYSISVPFSVGAGGYSSGVVTVNTSSKAVMSKVLKDNMLLYLALLVVLNNQVFILYYLTSKRQQDIIDKTYAIPYMKTHSIGALKVMRKILEEIIEDHPEEMAKKNSDADSGAVDEEPKKVIPLSKFLDKT